jgi:hypothetical protein
VPWRRQNVATRNKKWCRKPESYGAPAASSACLVQRHAGPLLLSFVQFGIAATKQQFLTSDTEISKIIAALLVKEAQSPAASSYQKSLFRLKRERVAMPGLVRKILIFVTGYAWLLLLAGPGLIGLTVYSGWKAEGDHAYAARESLQTVTGAVTQASEVTVKRKRRTTKKYYEITVQPDTAGAEVRKLRIDYSTPQQLVGNLIDEKVTALVDSSDSDLVYEVSAGGAAVISYETTKQRLQSEATSSAQSFSGAGTWIFAILLTLVGAAGVWSNRKLRAADEAQQLAAA